MLSFRPGDKIQIVTKDPCSNEILSTVISKVIKINNDRVHFIDIEILEAWKRTKHQVNPKHQIYFKDMATGIYEFTRIEDGK